MAKTKQDPQAALIDLLDGAIKSGVLKDVICEVNSPIKMQALRRSDKQYRTIFVSRGEEFALSGVRWGAKQTNKLIFEFGSLDPNGDYSQCELDDQKVFIAFPDLEPLVLRVMDLETTDTDDNPVRFTAVKEQFMMRAHQLEEKRAQEAADKEARAAASHYESHPNYGTWG